MRGKHRENKSHYTNCTYAHREANVLLIIAAFIALYHKLRVAITY